MYSDKNLFVVMINYYQLLKEKSTINDQNDNVLFNKLHLFSISKYPFCVIIFDADCVVVTQHNINNN